MRKYRLTGSGILLAWSNSTCTVVGTCSILNHSPSLVPSPPPISVKVHPLVSSLIPISLGLNLVPDLVRYTKLARKYGDTVPAIDWSRSGFGDASWKSLEMKRSFNFRGYARVVTHGPLQLGSRQKFGCSGHALRDGFLVLILPGAVY